MTLPATTESQGDGIIGYALRELSEGGHPLSYLSNAKLSLEAHAARYASNEAYRAIVNAAVTECLGFWKNYVNGRLISLDDDVIDVNEDIGGYEAVCRKEKARKRAATFSKKTDWKALFVHIDDIEHYAYKIAPHIKDLSKQSEADITRKSEDLRFTMEIVDSTTKKDADDD